jgi:argininosuccinate lyase
MPKKKAKLWSGRFKSSTDALVDEFNASINFDRRLARHDVIGSLAHSRVLARAGVLTRGERAKIERGLKRVEKELSTGAFAPTPGHEDIHMAIEARLTELVGPLGKKLHTGRSRNDQVALDIRLYLRDETTLILRLVKDLRETFVILAEAHVETMLPGYTHLQRAQPVTLGHHLLAYYEMLTRDAGRFADALKRADSMPLGSGALAGSPYKLDRNYAAKLLGFKGVTQNSLDAVSDRDFSIEFLAASALLMMHLSRLSEELIIWSSSEFGFVEFSDAFSTGSSIMPQKKNPDVAELVRGKTGRVYGSLVALLTVMKSLPLAYNKDMQEDKEPLFDAIDTIKASLQILPPMLRSMEVKKSAMMAATAGGFLTATDAADYLAKKGMPFRDCHHTAGRIVAYCMEKKKTLEELTLDEWQKFSKLFGPDIKRAVTAMASVAARRVTGGTAPSEIRKRLKEIKKEFCRERG